MTSGPHLLYSSKSLCSVVWLFIWLNLTLPSDIYQLFLFFHIILGASLLVFQFKTLSLLITLLTCSLSTSISLSPIFPLTICTSLSGLLLLSGLPLSTVSLQHLHQDIFAILLKCIKEAQEIVSRILSNVQPHLTMQQITNEINFFIIKFCQILVFDMFSMDKIFQKCRNHFFKVLLINKDFQKLVH